MKVVHCIDDITVKNHFQFKNSHVIVLPFDDNYHAMITLPSPNIHGV
jgi:hypothetical protein